MIAPSGEQLPISLGDQQAVIVEVGGGIRSYSAGGRELIDGYGAHEMSSSGRGQVLIPWPNRLEDGSYEFDGKHHQLPLNEPELRNAIHGLVRWATWSVAEREAHRVVMQHVLYPQPGYPFLLSTSIEYALSDRGLRVRTTTTNLSSERCPFGRGSHPYLTLGTATIDRLILTLPAGIVLQSDQRGLPIARKLWTAPATILGNHGQSALQYRPCIHRPSTRRERARLREAPRLGHRTSGIALG